MSVETPQVEESTPVVTKPVESTTTPNEVSAPVPSEPTAEKPAADLPTTVGESHTAADTTKEDAIVEAVPASEGVLGYKAPGLLKQFRFVKHFFWFNEEPITQEALDAYLKSEKVEIAHHNAAWAQETGKGVMFYAKRAEDKATPSGMILLHEATAITKVGSTDFSFKIGSHTHKFEAASSAERDSWVVAITKIASESKDLHAEITGRESYMKTIQGFSFSPIIAGSAANTPVKSSTPKKSLDVNTATTASTTEPAVEAAPAPVAAVDETQKTKEAEKQAKKERSQSRKRNSVFGLFAKKEEDKEKEAKREEKKAEKEHEKAEKKAEKEHVKEEKKIEAEHKKEEAKAEHDATKAKEAAEAAVVAAVPAAVVATEKKEEKHEDKTEEAVTPSDKKSKRSSVFGGFFAKHKLTSPSAEKSEKEASLASATQDETPAVAEVAPKLDEPIETKPIDAAAVTAPVDAPTTEAVAPVAVAPATEEVKATEPVAPVEAVTTPKTEKKSFLAGFMNKKEKKEETKPEKTTEEAAPVVPVTTEPTATDGAVDTVAKDAEAPKEERPTREKRRTSLFSSLGTLKRKTDKSPEPSSVAASEEAAAPEVKREKSPLPAKLGGLFRKPSRAAKAELATEEAKTDAAAETTEATATGTEATKTAEIPMTTEAPASTTVVEPTESKIVGDIVPDELHTTIHDVVTTTPAEVKATA